MYQPRADRTIERVPEGRREQGPATFSVTYPLDRDGTFFSGGGGLVSTAGDYARFLRMLQGGGALDGVRLLGPETVALMTRDHLSGIAEHALRDGGQGFGLGFSVVTGTPADPSAARGLGPVGTYGWGGFFNTQFWIDPGNGLIAVVMTQLRPSDHVGLRVGFGAQVYEALQAMAGASAPAAP